MVEPFFSDSVGYHDKYKTYAGHLDQLTFVRHLAPEERALQRRGYTVVRLTDHDVTVPRLIKELKSGRASSSFNAHGGENLLFTGQSLGSTRRAAEVAWKALVKGLHRAYPSLPVSSAIGYGLTRDGSGSDAYYVFVKACFLHVAGECLSQAPQSQPRLSLCLPVRRHPRFSQCSGSASLRVAGTRQAIYPYDSELGEAEDIERVRPGATGGTKLHLYGVLGGYAGTGGATPVPFLAHGWLSAAVKHGQVWWLLFAARWGQDAATGAARLSACYAGF